MKFNVVFEKSSWENQNPLGYFKKHIEFHVFLKNIRNFRGNKINNKENTDKNKIFEGSLEVKLPTIRTDEKQSRAEAERRERLEERSVEEKESEERRYRCAKR